MTAKDTDSTHPETLAFVAAGLVHRLGNLLFTIQGHAQLLPRSDGSDREAAAITGAADRGGRVLSVLRTLLGPVNGPPEGAEELLTVIAELARIPLREAGYTLVQSMPEQSRFRGVAGGVFCPAVLEAIRLIAKSLPAGQGGSITVELADGASETLRVRIGHVAGKGSLPFPLAIDQVRAEVEQAVRLLARTPRISVDSTGIELTFGSTGAETTAGQA